MSKIISSKKIFSLIFVIIFIISTLVLFSSVLNYYFFQDDWFHLKISNAQNVKDFISFFMFRTDIIAWRPVSKQIFFFLIINVFNVNSFIPHLIIFSFHLSNVFLIYKLVIKVRNNTLNAIVTAFLYSTAAFHFTTLAWISAGELTIGTFFYLLASLMLLNYFSSKKISDYILAIISFVLCLSSTEFAVTWPLFITLLIFLSNKSKKKLINYLKPILIPVFLILVYLGFRLLIYKVPVKDNYEISFGPNIIKNFLWYNIWLLNVPEDVRAHVRLLPFAISKDFINAGKEYLLPISIPLFIFLAIILRRFISLFSKNTLHLFLSTFAFLFLSLLPVLIFPNHISAHYLLIPSIGIYIFLGYILSKKYNKSSNKRHLLFVFFTCCCWFLLSFSSLALTKKINWIPGEQSLSRNLTTKIQKKYPYLPSYSSLLIYDSDLKIKHALMDQYALQVLFNDETLKTIYTEDANLGFSTNNFFIKMN